MSARKSMPTKLRCKPGDRARVVRGFNVGKIVVVERVYVANERLHGVIWEESGGPWVVTSLSGLLASRRVVDDAICDPHRTVVISDTHLQPLRDDEGGIEDSAARRNPVAKPRRRKAVPA